jgi:hypothetical protein
MIFIASPRGMDTGATCYTFRKDGHIVSMAIPDALVPTRDQRKAGSRFDLNLGVNLRDFSPYSSFVTLDSDVGKPDWSPEQYDYGAGLVIGSAQSPAFELEQIELNHLKDSASDVAGYRRFESCAGCAIDIYVPISPSGIQAFRCYVPTSISNVTGCHVTENYFSLNVEYVIPYNFRNRVAEFSSRVHQLVKYFETMAAKQCPAL